MVKKTNFAGAKKTKKATKKKQSASAKRASRSLKKKKLVKRKKAALSATATLTRPSNRAILDSILGGHWPDNKPIAELHYDDPPSRLALAEQIAHKSVPVDIARIDEDDTTVGDVHREMNRVKPEWKP